MESASEQLAQYYLGLEANSLPQTVIKKTKQCIMDFLGCVIGGLDLETTNIVRESFDLANSPGNSTVILYSNAIAADRAAFINAVSGHGLEMDDVNLEYIGHPAVVILPAALAIAEQEHSTGQELIRALVAGYDLTCRLGAAAVPDNHFGRGFHPTSTIGAFGATAATSLLMKLNKKQFANALGIVGSFTSGNLECYADGSMTKRINPAVAAQGAIQATKIASLGYKGPRWIFEGTRGFLRGYTDNAKPELLTKDMNYKAFSIMNTSFKPYASCRYNHAPIDACLQIIGKHNIDYNDINSVKVKISSTAMRGVGEPKEIKYAVPTVVSAQFSLPYNVALAFIKQRCTLEDFTIDAIQDQTIRDFIPKVEMDTFTPDEIKELNSQATLPAKITVTVKSGDEYSALVEFAKGDPRAPMTEEEIEAKFTSLSKEAIGDAGKLKQVIAQIHNIDTINVRDLMLLLGPLH